MKKSQPNEGMPQVFLLAASIFFLLSSGLWGQTVGPNAQVPQASASSPAAPQAASSASQAPQILIKDLVHVEGLRDNQLTGLGIVTGLAGQGDSSNNPMLRYALSSLTDNLGLSIPFKDLKSKNAAVVTVTCTLGPYVNPGDSLDVRVSSLGDATSLAGGILLQTPLLASNGKVYAVAQGPVAVSALAANKTTATLAGGAIAEKSVASDFTHDGQAVLLLNRADFATAQAIHDAIAKAFPDLQAAVPDPGHVVLTLPKDHSAVGILSRVEALSVSPDPSSDVVVNRATGVVVAGRGVRIAKVAVSVKGAKVTIGKSQPSDWGSSNSSEQFLVPDAATVEDLVTLLQQIGLTTDQLIDVLQAINDAGALYGHLIVLNN